MECELARPGQTMPSSRDIPADSLEIIGAGWGRTGTLSLRSALEMLGFAPCDHMELALAQRERLALWQDVAERKRRGQPVDWRPLMQGYRAALDWPAAYFWQALAAAHPQAKVILTVRQPDRWYESVASTLYPLHAKVEGTAWAKLLMELTGLADPALRAGYQLTNDLVWQGTFGGRFTDRRHALHAFQEHRRCVEATIAPGRLLVLDLAQGWEPLCRFLGKCVPPGVAFPHVNDRDAFQRRVRRQVVQQGLRYGGATAAAALGTVAMLQICKNLLRS